MSYRLPTPIATTKSKQSKPETDGAGAGMNYIIIIPCYNEEENIIQTVNNIKNVLPSAPILIIDDGSRDTTYEKALSIKLENVSIIRHPINLGYGSAIQTGAKFAFREGYDSIILFDADGQHSATDLSLAIDLMNKDEADVVLGSRFLGSCSYKVPAPRKIGIIAFRWLLKRFSGLHITDPTSGFQALNRKAIRICISDDFSVDFPDADMLMIYKRSGLRVLEIPAHFKERIAGTSMHNYLKGFYYVYKVTLSMLMVAMRSYPKVGDS